MRTLRAAGRYLSIPILLILLISALAVGVTADDNGVTISPDTNDLVLNEGDTFGETLTVTIPADAIGKADVYLLADTTGSMGTPINAVRTGASDIIDGLIADLPGIDLAFGAGDFKDFQSPNQSDPYAFNPAQGITDDATAVKAAINAWTASGGVDGPEGQFYAYDQLAEDRAPSNDGSPAGTIGWRTDAKRILVVFGDAPAHDPVCSAITSQVNGHELAYDITEASVTQKLVDASITFIGISTLTGVPNGMDGAAPMFDYTTLCGTTGLNTAGQATRIAAATGGVHQVGVDSAAIVQVIKDEITAAVNVINSLTLVASGDTAPFVTSIDPAAGFGPLELDEEQTVDFDVEFTGVVACADRDQVFHGSLDVVADGVVVTQKTVTITVPACAILDGRMTGGGSVFTEEVAGVHEAGVRVTHGFTLQCDVNNGPNNLQVNWGQGRDAQRFHLEALDSALCSDDPNIDPSPPAAGFDTYTGSGTGRLNNVSGATAEWVFTDAGQPGTGDTATIRIWDADGDLVLEVSGNLNNGNHQAH